MARRRSARCTAAIRIREVVVFGVNVAFLEFKVIVRVSIFEIDALVCLVRGAAEAEEFCRETSAAAAAATAVEGVFALFFGEQVDDVFADVGAALFAEGDAEDEDYDEDHDEEGGDLFRMFDEEAVPVAVGFVGVRGAAGILEVGWYAGHVGAETDC